mgnify:CR=1 FL=1
MPDIHDVTAIQTNEPRVLRAEQGDQIVWLGDASDMHSRTQEAGTPALLKVCGAHWRLQNPRLRTVHATCVRAPARGFAAFPHLAAFMGHCQLRLALSRAGRVDRDCRHPLTVQPGTRYLVIVAPVFNGAFAALNTDRWILEPRCVPVREEPSP